MDEIREEQQRAWRKHGDLPDNRSVCLNIILKQLGQAVEVSLGSENLTIEETMLLRKKLIKVAATAIQIVYCIDMKGEKSDEGNLS